MLARRLLCVCLTLSLLIGFLPTAEAAYEYSPNIQAGDIWFMAIGQPSTEGVPYQKHDKAWLEVDLRDNYGDVYIMNCNEYYKLEAGEPFKFVEGKENVTGKVRLEHIKQDDRYEEYCAIVDNTDSARANDAVPNGTLECDIAFDWDNRHQTIFFYKLIAIGAVISVGIFAALFIYIKKIS